MALNYKPNTTVIDSWTAAETGFIAALAMTNDKKATLIDVKAAFQPKQFEDNVIDLKGSLEVVSNITLHSNVIDPGMNPPYHLDIQKSEDSKRICYTCIERLPMIVFYSVKDLPSEETQSDSFEYWSYDGSQFIGHPFSGDSVEMTSTRTELISILPRVIDNMDYKLLSTQAVRDYLHSEDVIKYLQGPSGPQGSMGETGFQGPKGETGDDPTAYNYDIKYQYSSIARLHVGIKAGSDYDKTHKQECINRYILLQTTIKELLGITTGIYELPSDASDWTNLRSDGYYWNAGISGLSRSSQLIINKDWYFNNLTAINNLYM